MSELSTLGQGFYWQDLKVGQKFRTYRRTITETDLVNFISVTGMLEAIFIDAEYSGAAGAIKGQWNGALTGSMIERRAPCSAASVTARSTAARSPLTTICPGLLSLATAQT